jgi:hypothetical protein
VLFEAEEGALANRIAAILVMMHERWASQAVPAIANSAED